MSKLRAFQDAVITHNIVARVKTAIASPEAKTAAWDDEIQAEAKTAKDAVADALKASEKAKQAVNALVHLASKHNIARTPPFSPIVHLDLLLHKANSPSDMYSKAVKDLEEIEKKIKG